MKKNENTRNKFLLLLTLLLVITLGYSLVSTTLKIGGSTTISKNVWSVYWDSPVVTTGSVNQTLPVLSAETGKTLNTIATWSATLNEPGDFYEFTIDAVNDGTIDAMISDVELKIDNSPIIHVVNNSLVTVDPSPVPSYLKYSVKYADGKEVGLKHLLKKKKGNVETRKTYKIRVEFDRDAVDATTLLGENEQYEFSFTVTYSQADSSAIDIRYCPSSDCVYAFYTAWTMYTGANAATLTGYTSDYTTLKKDGVQRYAFFGHILDDNDKILKPYACGIKDNEIFCIQGSNNGSTYQDARGALYSLFGQYDENTELGCKNESNHLFCKSSSEITEARAFESGQVTVKEPKASCMVVNVGGMNCSDY